MLSLTISTITPFLIGEWSIKTVPENGVYEENTSSLICVEFHIKPDTQQLVGSIWINNAKNTYEVYDLDKYLLDIMELFLNEDKIKLNRKSAPNEDVIFECEFSDEKSSFQGTINGISLSIELLSQNKARIIYGEDQFDAFREESPDSAPLPSILKENHISNPIDFFTKYKKYLPYVYGVIAILVGETLIVGMIKSCCKKQ